MIKIAVVFESVKNRIQTFATRNEKHSRLFDVFLACLRSTRAFNIDNDCSYTSRLV